MQRGSIATTGLVLLWSATALAATKPAGKAPTPWKPPQSATAPAPAPASPPGKTGVFVSGVYDTGQFLPDTTELARVNDRIIRIGRFVDAYFASLIQSRPANDSAGRVEFLNSMVNKEILALTAQAINRPLEYEDRITLRGHTDRALANALYQRAVLDSVTVTDADLQRVYEQHAWQVHYWHVQLDDPRAAEQVRRALVAKQITWAEAVKRYSNAEGAGGPNGDMGWISRATLDLWNAELIWNLAPGEIAPVIQDPSGFHVMRMVERRRTAQPALEPLRKSLTEQIRVYKASQRATRLQAQIGARIGLAYDTTNIMWAAAQLRGHEAITNGPTGPVIDVSGALPDFMPADTARVLGRYRDGHFTLGDFLHAYNAISPVMRKPVGDFASFRGQMDGIVLEPYMAEEARVRGLERDPLAATEIDSKREEIAVEHLYSDSVESKVWIPPAERRKYYDEHLGQYMTYSSVRFAAIIRSSREGADSLVARLDHGERAEAILRADSLAGWRSGSVQERREDVHGPYEKLLFGELRPGKSAVQGPDREGNYLVIQLLEFDPGHQLPYEQVQQYVDDALQNIHSEEMLKALIARHRKRYHIEVHPDLVMRIKLVDPTLE